MSAGVAGKSQRVINFGQRIDRPGALVPQTATVSIFTVTGGRVLVTGITGLITVAGSATDPLMKIVSTPTVGSTGDMTAAVATFTTSAIGGILSVDGLPTAAMVYSQGAGTLLDAKAIVVPAGAIRVTCGASNATLQVQWTLLYVPLDDGASVAAA